MIGHQIKHYRIERRIGGGSMGEVYKAINLTLDREVAIKIPYPELMRDPQMQTRFLTEATTSAKLDHPNVARVHDCFSEDRYYFMVMEFIPGETLQQVIERCGAMPWKKAIPLFCQVLEGIGHAHHLSIIHRDIKPSNIMLTPDNRIKVMDFGIARILGTTRKTRTRCIVGTPEYMSPEQIRSLDLDNRTDIYSLGMVLYEMLTANLPFSCESEYDLLQAQVNQPPPLPREFKPEIPFSIESTILRALSKERDQRFQNIEEFSSNLLSELDFSVPTTGKLFPIYTNPLALDRTKSEPESGEGGFIEEKHNIEINLPRPTREQFTTDLTLKANIIEDNNLLVVKQINASQLDEKLTGISPVLQNETQRENPNSNNTQNSYFANLLSQNIKNFITNISSFIRKVTTSSIINSLTWKHYSIGVGTILLLAIIPFLTVKYITEKLDPIPTQTTVPEVIPTKNPEPIALPGQPNNADTNNQTNSTVSDNSENLPGRNNTSTNKENITKKETPVNTSPVVNIANSNNTKEKVFGTLLDIQTQPAGCEVLVDGVSQGTTNVDGNMQLSNLIINQNHEIKIRKPNYKENTYNIKFLRNGQKLRLTPFLTLLPQKTATKNESYSATQTPNTNLQPSPVSSPKLTNTIPQNFSSSEALINAAKADNSKLMSLLVQQGADVNAQDSSRKTALIYAARSGREKSVKTLISLGSNVRIRDNNGKTALIYAAENGHDNTTKVLISAGSDLNAKDNNGRTALSYAISNSHQNVIRVLQNAGARN